MAETLKIKVTNETYLSTKQKEASNYMWLSQENENCQRSNNCQSPPQSGTQETHPGVSFPKEARVRSRNHYYGILKAGNKVFGKSVGVDYRLGRALRPRLGITVSKKYGKAHDRNRFKRVVREAFRSYCLNFPKDLEINVFPRTTLKPLSKRAILDDLVNLCSILNSKKL